MQKLCTKCREIKDIERFAYRSRAKGTRQSWCRVCTSKHDRETHRSKEHKVQVRANSARYRARNYTWIFHYLEEHPCMDCGEADPRILQFHHPNDDKERGVGNLTKGSLERLQHEVAKCVVLCANCHHLRTCQQYGGHPFEKLGLL